MRREEIGGGEVSYIAAVVGGMVIIRLGHGPSDTEIYDVTVDSLIQ